VVARVTAGFTFEPLAEAHLEMLREWLLRPHVAAWWGEADAVDELRVDYVDNRAAPDATRAYIAMLAGPRVGFVQCYVVMGTGGGWWEGEIDPGARGIDQFLADPHRLGQGLGRAMIGAFVEQLFADPSVTVVQTDPAPANLRAIRCYEAAGFERVGLVATPDGEALLMRRPRR
jgi:RimJ/RimL family protein N-acetyltransferase